MIDRFVAATSSMAATLYMMAASIAWFRVLFPSPSDSLAQRVMPDRAWAWSALSVIFSVVVAVKLKLVDWDDPIVGFILALAIFVVFVSGLTSVRAITVSYFGNRILFVFGLVSVTVGLLVFYLGD